MNISRKKFVILFLISGFAFLFISASEERVDEYSRTQRPSEDEI